jgi:hypothetical protein
LVFMQTLNSLYVTNHIGFLWWTAGDWTNTPGAGALGALQCGSTPQGWGCLIAGVPSAGGGGTVTLTINPLVTGLALTGILGAVIGVVVWDRRKK